VRVVVKVLRKRQVTIPKEVSERLGISEGDYLAFIVEGDRIVVEKVDPLELLEGFLAKSSGRGVAEEIDRGRKASER